MLAYTHIEQGKSFSLLKQERLTPLPHQLPLSKIEKAYRIFENKLDGVIKVAII